MKSSGGTPATHQEKHHADTYDLTIKDFVQFAAEMMAHNDRVNNEFYTCPVYNYAIKAGRKIGIYEISASQMHGLGTPEDLREYLQLVGAAR